MISDKPGDFEQRNREISECVSKLRYHGVNLILDDNLRKQIDPYYLFDGDDGLFKKFISDARIYFEYGCGKSTEYVFKNTNCSIFSVDTSREWSNRIKNASNNEENARLNVKWVDVGPVEDWGKPLSFEKRSNFREYTDWFWRLGVDPDLVVIDGRFRVCCFLTTIKYARVGTRILFDDYADRRFYHVAEEFLSTTDRCGRQSLFVVDDNAKRAVTDDAIDQFRNVID